MEKICSREFMITYLQVSLSWSFPRCAVIIETSAKNWRLVQDSSRNVAICSIYIWHMSGILCKSRVVNLHVCMYHIYNIYFSDKVMLIAFLPQHVCGVSALLLYRFQKKPLYLRQSIDFLSVSKVWVDWIAILRGTIALSKPTPV